MSQSTAINGPLSDLTGFQRDILVIVRKLNNEDGEDGEDPIVKGLSVKTQLEKFYEEEIHHGRLYPNLDTLVEKGLLKKKEIDGRTNRYTMTRRGKRELNTHIDWITDTSPSDSN